MHNTGAANAFMPRETIKKQFIVEVEVYQEGIKLDSDALDAIIGTEIGRSIPDAIAVGNPKLHDADEQPFLSFADVQVKAVA